MTDPVVHTVAVVVPDWLQTSLAVLLESMADFKLVAKASSVEDLISMEFSSAPDLILLDAPKDLALAHEELVRLKSHWPETYCIALAAYAKDCDDLRAYGADKALIKGVPPGKLVAAVKAYRDG